jgi:hypothetical protein
VPAALAIARSAVRRIKQNLFWALAYNVLGIGLACTGRLNPVWAALAMTLSGTFVLANSLKRNPRVAVAQDSASVPAPLDHQAAPQHRNLVVHEIAGTK